MTSKPKPEAVPKFIEKEVDQTGGIAHHYGFTSITPPHITAEDKTKAKNLKELDLYPLLSEERVALLRFFNDSPFGTLPQPGLFYVKKPFGGSGQKKKPTQEVCGLEVINSPRAVAEALVLKTAWAILSEEDHADMYIDINSTGDKESFAKFERELTAYFKKNMHLVSATDRQRFKTNIFSIVQATETHLESFVANAPKSLNTLSEVSRDHFKEVLEFLESFGISYRIAHNLIPPKGSSSHTQFEIRKTVVTKKGEVSELVAYGGRYNYLAKKVGYKKEFPSCGITLMYTKKAGQKKIDTTQLSTPRFYVVQLGNHAKLRMLNVIELLRKEKIPVYHSLTKEKITGQLSSAEYLGVSHILIIGQKEAIEETVIVRSVDTREQETMHIKELSKHLKGLHKAKK
ncbi:MAG: His/Gly/Thr/Pro-type tRNA ligase C-terminal domain-containing protein [Candidatus Zambryskibacteria bacterium]|nr:His/Gly/Thr/Pro-type tRNA ligase C-terminal domain-containing protein [Candidatus Zambryskibacteria bacterium]